MEELRGGTTWKQCRYSNLAGSMAVLEQKCLAANPTSELLALSEASGMSTQGFCNTINQSTKSKPTLYGGKELSLSNKILTSSGGRVTVSTLLYRAFFLSVGIPLLPSTFPSSFMGCLGSAELPLFFQQSLPFSAFNLRSSIQQRQQKTGKVMSVTEEIFPTGTQSLDTLFFFFFLVLYKEMLSEKGLKS